MPQYMYPPYPAYPFFMPPPPLTPEEELEMLEDYKASLEEEIEDIKEELKGVEERIKELREMFKKRGEV